MSQQDDPLFDDLDDELEDKTEAFRRQVDKNIAILMSPKKHDSKKRLAAAQWLGESGEPKAIESLVKVYKRDKDARIRKAAEFALGQFRALELALDGTSEEQEDALDLLDKVVNQGQMGGSARLSRRLLGGIVLILGLLLLVWLGLAQVLGPDTEDTQVAIQPTVTEGGPTITPTPRPDPRATLRDLQAQYIRVDQDARALLQQYNTITRQEAQDCSTSFAAPEALTIDLNMNEFPEIAALADAIESTRQTIEELRIPFQTSCRTGIAIARTQALRYGDDLIAAQIELAAIPALFNEIDLGEFSTEDSTDNPGNSPAIESTPTSEASATPAPSPTYANLQVHALTATGIITQMNNLRGANTLLLQYWRDVQSSGSTAGCLEIVPTIPEDYVLSPQDREQAPAALVEAIDTLNLGLSLTRQSWVSFSAACNNDTLSEAVNAQVQFAQLAQDAYLSADEQLQALLR